MVIGVINGVRVSGLRRAVVALLFALTLVLGGLLLAVASAEAGGPDGLPAARAAQSAAAALPGEVLVRIEAGVSTSSVNALARSLGSDTFRDLGVSAILPQGERILLFKSTQLTGAALVKAALQNANVADASLNHIWTIDSLTPNDPRFPEMWGLNNSGQTGGTADADIDAPEAWSTTTGSSGVVVADIDTGVAYDHVDLAANMWHNPGETPGNGIDDDFNGYVDDVYGIDAANGDTDPYDDNAHGTHTSGTMAAVGNNGIGISGVAWQARIMALKFLDAAGSGTTANAIICINYVVGEKLNHGVNVVAINASWGGGLYNSTLHDAINAAGAAGIVFCAAAGNNGTDNDTTPNYPASYDCASIISVAATDNNDALWSSSCYGATSVDMSAPGVNILSTVPGSSNFTINPSGPFYDTMESGIGGWTAQFPWAITTEQALSPTHAWSDSPSGSYANHTNAALTTPVINLSALPGPDAFGFYAKYDIENGWDYLYVEFSNDGGSTWRLMGSLTGSSGGSWLQYSVRIPADMRVSNFRARLRLVSDVSVNYDGVYVDNVGFGSLAPSNAYEGDWSGTSMATPHVTGAVALCAAHFPSETAAQRIQRILGHVDPIASMTGKCVSGGRLNLSKALPVTIAPTITGFTPTSGPVGTSVTLTGTGFTGATAVRFNGTAASVFNVVSATQLTATVPAGATTGTIAVTTPGGTGTSAALFFVVPAGDGGWSELGRLSSRTLLGVDFPDATHGWAVGLDGAIVATTDGGATSSVQSSGTDIGLVGVAFPDATHGWAVGYIGTIRATTNGGTTWSAQGSGTSAMLLGVSSTDSDHAWAVGGGGAIRATANGGATWSAQSSGTTATLFGVAFPDAAHGWAVGENGTILATSNGGTTWSPQSSGTSATLEAVSFPDATRGWAVGNSGTILATTNGGATWSAQSSGTPYDLSGVDFLDATHGWAVGGIGAIVATTNGGATWSAQLPGVALVPCAVGFGDVMHGWVVGASQDLEGIILHTSSGGFPSPTITGFTPTSGPVGTSVTLTGTGFTGATAVRFNGTAASVFNVVSATQLTATVPAGATTGTIAVTTPGGTGTSSGSFTVLPTLTVTAPNGGEYYPSGSVQTWSWTATPAQSTGVYAVWAVSAVDYTAYWMGSTSALDGQTSYSMNWRVDPPAGSYRLLVSYGFLPATWLASDYSDAAFTITEPPPTLAVTAPPDGGSYAQSASPTFTWTSSAALPVGGEFAVWVNKGSAWYVYKLVATDGTAAYSTTVPLSSVPIGTGYRAVVAYRPAAGVGAWTTFAASSGAFTVTAGVLSLTVTAPPDGGSYAQSASPTFTWTSSAALPVGGEFAVWVNKGSAWYVYKLVATDGTAAYSTTVPLSSVPIGTGYRAVVAYRPAAGVGAWTTFAASSGAFTVTAGVLSLTVTAPPDGGSYAQSASPTFTWTSSAALPVGGEFAVWVNKGSAWYVYKLVATDGTAAYSTTVPLSSVPIGTGYRAVVAYRPAAGVGAWTTFAASSGAFTVTAGVLSLTVTAPPDGGSYAQSASPTFTWTSSAALPVGGEFAVWVNKGSAWYVYKLVATDGTAAYSTTVPLSSVPIGTGYRAVVAYRPAAGVGAWTAFGSSPGSFAVGP